MPFKSRAEGAFGRVSEFKREGADASVPGLEFSLSEQHSPVDQIGQWWRAGYYSESLRERGSRH